MAEDKPRAGKDSSVSRISTGGRDNKNTPEGDVAGVAGGNQNRSHADAAGDTKPAGAGLAQAQAAEVAAVIATDPTAGTDAEQVAVDDAEGIERLVSRADVGEFVRLDVDVVEKFYYPLTKRPSYRVLFHKNQVVARSVLTARAADIRLAADAQSDDVATRIGATVDATTLAAGTYPGVAAVGAAAGGGQ